MDRRRASKFLLLAVVAALPLATQAQEKPFRIGMIGLDTSHVIAFTQIINNPENSYGCRVVTGYPGGSPDIPASADRVEKFTAQLRDRFNVEIVGTIEQLCQKVDGVMLESVDGRPHLKQAIPVIRAKKRLFVDKPVAASLSDVIKIFHLAQESDVPCWSSSAFRYGEKILGVRDNQEIGRVKGCDVFGSSSWTEFHPDLYLYGIHPVTALFTVMGPGCETVTRHHSRATYLMVGVWKDGRIGTFRDLRGGKSDAAAYVYGMKGMFRGKSLGYKPLVDEIVKFFKTGKVLVSAEETIEIYAFMSAADESKALGGAPVSIKAIIEKAKKHDQLRSSESR